MFKISRTALPVLFGSVLFGAVAHAQDTAQPVAPEESQTQPAPLREPPNAEPEPGQGEAKTGEPTPGQAPPAPAEADGNEAPTAPAEDQQGAPTPVASTSVQAAASEASTAADAATASGPIIVLAEEDEVVSSAPEPEERPVLSLGIGDDDYRKRTSVIEGGDLIDRIGEDENGVTLGGYGEHMIHDRKGQTASFVNQRYVLFIYARLNDRISTSTELELEFGGSPLKRNGVFGAGEVLLEFSVLDFEIAEWLTLRGGIILMPVGSFNINHDAPTRDLVDRPIGYTTVVPSTWFESGAGILGKIALPADMSLHYELYMVNGLDARISDGFGLRAARGSHLQDNNSDKAFVGRLAFRPTLNSEFGISGYSGEYDKRGNRVNIINGDFRMRFSPFEFLGELAYVKIDPGFVEGFPASSAANTRDAVPEGMFTFFVQANYHFRIEPLFKLFPEDMAQAVMTAVVRYEGMDTDTNYDSALGDRTRLTLGLNFRPIEQVVLKSDFQWNAQGIDGVRKAPQVFQGGFWDDRTAGFLFDSYVASIAYLF